MESRISEQLIKEYLISHNYNDTLSAFENESSKEKTRRNPSEIVEVIQQAVQDSNLTQLVQTWSMLENRFFHRLDTTKQESARCLKLHTFRSYLVFAKLKKRKLLIDEFFESLSSEFNFASDEWRSWCALPYVNEPQKVPEFFMYCTKTWMDILKLSLTNFLCMIIYSETVNRNPYREIERIQEVLKASTLNEKQQKSSSGQFFFGEVLDDFNELGTIRTNPKHT